MRLFATALLIGAEIAFLLYLERTQRSEQASAPAATRPESSIRIGTPEQKEEAAPDPVSPPASESAPVPIPHGYDRLTRSPGGAPPGSPDSRSVPYTIKSKDSLIRIAKRHGVSWKEIAKANGNVDPKRLKVGQVLRIPVLAKADPAPPR